MKTMYFEWDNDLATGFEDIDKQHQGLIAIINDALCSIVKRMDTFFKYFWKWYNKMDTKLSEKREVSIHNETSYL